MLFLFNTLCLDITPVPQQAKVTDPQYLYLSKLQWKCTAAGKDCLSLLTNMKELYEQALYSKGEPTPKSGGAKIDVLDIQLTTVQTPKSVFETNETYRIEINKSGVFIAAADTYGLSRALATFVQLVTEAPEDKWQKGLYVVQSVEVTDYPVHQFRSVMVDTARHYLTFESLLRQVRAIAVTKMNVLHIHLIDSQSNSFKPESKPADEFAKSAFTSNGITYLYNMSNLTALSEYANSLGVFILVEFDMPGHAGNTWRNVNPEISANCPSQGYSSINPINDLTFTYIQKYIEDLFNAVYKPVNQYPMIHLGGDEVDHNCWKSDALIAGYMKQKGISTQQLWQEFHKRVADLINKIDNKTTRFYWQESFDNQNDMSGNVVVHSWMNINKKVVEIVNKGFKALRSDQWYLDVQQPGQVRPKFIESWMDMYNVKPYDGVAADKMHLVLGGATCLWSEKVNSGNVDGMIWPRAIAVAEILWAEPNSREINQQLKSRLNKLVCVLTDIGVASHALTASEPCPSFTK